MNTDNDILDVGKSLFQGIYNNYFKIFNIHIIITCLLHFHIVLHIGVLRNVRNTQVYTFLKLIRYLLPLSL